MRINLLVFLLGIFWLPLALAQEAEPAEDADDSSDQVEQRDDSYRRQMELEDARARDRSYIDNTYTPSGDLEKIDKLPEESRENIRDQLVDVIMENGEWEPSDALEEYPYQPTAAAQADAELMEQEQEAWDEQIEKYHKREAAAFGSYRGPVPGPGNPTGQEGGQQGGEQGSGQEGQDSGQGADGSGSAGTYQPYEPNSSSSEDETSTAGVSESALDFLRSGRTGAQQQQAQQAENPEQLAEQSSEQAEEQVTAEQQRPSEQAIQPDLRGIIAIQDLDKLEGTEIPVAPEEQEDP
ncbi:MAG: hypothetical protein HKO99_05770 [Xanthomonadales bacterium]|nr:hypothetical protein [Gammaproteobacteria bacterium]MBT8054828.1 hypothetical protein [Gammaproteobacteria bacterium]NNK51093.1 hypothetical protein [Xanthomonadales bacterium]